MRRTAIITALFALALVAGSGRALADNAEQKAGQFTPAVKEITVFKDGHALILQQGEGVPVEGWVATDAVPEPVLGTFGAFTRTGGAKLEMVRAGFRDVEKEEPCVSIHELVRANAGKDVILTLSLGDGKTRQLQGVLEEVPEKEVSRQSEYYRQGQSQYYDRNLGRYVQVEPLISEEKQIVRADYVGVKNDRGTNYILIKDITGIEIIGVSNDCVTNTERTRELALKVSGAAGKVKVGFAYLQKGIRWIPSYRVVRSGKDKVKVILSATVINDIVDIENVKCHLVVGVPNFLMKDRLDPLALKQFMGKLSSYFYSGRGSGRDSGFATLSNTMMSQYAFFSTESRSSGGPGEGNDEDEEMAAQVEDLFLYHRDALTLKKGERATFSLFEVEVPCEDVYVWDVPFMPPVEVLKNFASGRQRELSKFVHMSRAVHKLRITNESDYPFTTGPAMIFEGDKVLGQDMITYTSPGNKIDLPVTVAIDLNVKKSEKETMRVRNLRINDDNYTKVVIEGTLTVKNYKKEAVKLAVNKTLFGKAIEAPDGKITVTHFLDEMDNPSEGYSSRPYWYWWNWSYWYWRVNSVSRVEWKVSLEPEAEKEFKYTYEYFYR